MTIKDEMLLIEMLTKDLKAAVLEFDEHCKELRKQGNNYKPSLGYGSSAVDPWKGLEQGETSYAIERKIVTIREHLNTLRKRIVYYNGYKEQKDDTE